MNQYATKQDLMNAIQVTDADKLKKLYQKAYEQKVNAVGKKVYFRGIIELSNICEKNCLYCGIRKDNKKVERFMMQENEILSAAQWCYEQKYGSLVLQSGERSDSTFIDFISSLLKKIKKLSNGKLGITLSLGEQSLETYKKWFDAGAHRYLLRIETSNKKLYQQLHPSDHDFDERVRCLQDLRLAGYQVGTGVMIGLPNQTYEDLVNDILFFQEYDIDMIGMGPYVIHHDTPLASEIENFDKEKQLELALKMIALTRLYLKDVNIASATALQALHPQGREFGLQAGANIIMPVITDTKYRKHYLLYEDKPCIDENATMCRSCLESRIQWVGEDIGYGEWGDSPHFAKRRDHA